MKKITLIIVLLFCSALTLSACQGTALNEKSYDYSSLVDVKINPETELVLDEFGTVEAVNPVNEDAEIILSDVDLIGLSAEDAVNEIVEAAAESGYLADGSNVQLEVIGETEEAEDKLERTLSEKINGFFKNNGINGKVSTETITTYSEEIAALNVSAGRAKKLMRALDMDLGYTLVQLNEMDNSELIALLSEKVKYESVGATLKNQFNDDLSKIKEKYADMFALSKEIASLEASLNEFEESSEEYLALQEELFAKKEAYLKLREEYKGEVSQLKDTYKSKQSAVKEERKAQKDLRREKVKKNAEKDKNQ